MLRNGIYDPFPRAPEVSGRANVCANSRAVRVIGILQFVDVNGPRRKLVKRGKRLVRRVTYK